VTNAGFGLRISPEGLDELQLAIDRGCGGLFCDVVVENHC
jgi:hypothetical protein